ncbi:hypothetical protein BH10ACT3_BH10ACT3_20950 [soil metagenome]
MSDPATVLTERLQQSIKVAMTSRDRPTVAVLRSVLGAVQNAQAVSADSASIVDGDSHIAGAVDGLGAGDVPRRRLSVDDLVAILNGEVDDRVTASEQYRQLGRDEEAARMDQEAAVIRDVQSGTDQQH